MSTTAGVIGVVLVALATLGIGTFGLRVSRTTSDFYVASCAVSPSLNASAISGEYLSAASFLGAAGLILVHGADALWYPVGWTAGYLVLLVLVAAPLRRSGAYTLADFAELRLESQVARRVASLGVALIGMLYLLPQFQGAGITMRTLTGAPTWVGSTLVALVVLVIVRSGGMRSITIVQAFQFWLKLTALALPAAFLLVHWHVDGSPRVAALHARDWAAPLTGPHALYLCYSLILATFLGTMGLPHVVVRFYTNTDGRAARRTTLAVLGLLGCFYLLPTVYGVLGRIYAQDLVRAGHADTVVLRLPAEMVHGPGADLCVALLGAGAFAAFLSTSSGLVVSVAGVLSQDVLHRAATADPRRDPVQSFRVATLLTVSVAVLLAYAAAGLPVASAVELAFAVAASTFFPLLLLGIWWRGLTAHGAVAGIAVGGLLSAAAVVATLAGFSTTGWFGAVIAQPAACTVPLALMTMVGVSLATRRHRAPGVARTMVRLHTPERLDVDRGSYDPETVRPTEPTARRAPG